MTSDLACGAQPQEGREGEGLYGAVGTGVASGVCYGGALARGWGVPGCDLEMKASLGTSPNSFLACVGACMVGWWSEGRWCNPNAQALTKCLGCPCPQGLVPSFLHVGFSRILRPRASRLGTGACDPTFSAGERAKNTRVGGSRSSLGDHGSPILG